MQTFNHLLKTEHIHTDPILIKVFVESNFENIFFSKIKILVTRNLG